MLEKKKKISETKKPVHPKDRVYEAGLTRDHQVVLKIQNSLSLDPDEPFPILVSGDSYLYERDQKYIPFLDDNDDLANVLLQARLTSTTQNSCIDSIARALIGKGVKTDVETPNKKLLDWMEAVNSRRQSFSEFLVQTVDGYGTFGNQFIEVVRGRVGATPYMKIYNHSMRFCRLLTPKDFEDPNAVLLSRLLAKQGYISDYGRKAPRIPLWNDSEFDNANVWIRKQGAIAGEQSTMLHFKNEISGIEHYGLPPSIASLRYQILEAKAAQFNIDNFDNNMILGGLLIFKGGMTQSEALANAREIMLSHVGDGKTGRIGVVSSEEGLNEVQFIPYSTQREGSFMEFDKRVEEKIICAHSWDSVLAGINRSSTLGNGSQYIRSIWDVKKAVLIGPLRSKLIEKVINPILTIWADWFNTPEVLKYKIDLKTNMPFSYMADLDPNKFYQVNEARREASLPNDDSKNGVYLSEIQGPQQPNQFNNGFVQTDGNNSGGKNGTK